MYSLFKPAASSVQPVSWPLSVWRRAGALLGVGDRPLLPCGVVGVDMDERG